MNNQRNIDLKSRDLIIHNTNTNYFVEAGAGSGKTTVLVERMVAMIEEGKNIEHICAITFTKAAANEFYARFQKRLIERSNEPTALDFKPSPIKLNNPNDETRRRCKLALQNIDLAFMGTIDAFCNMIMSEHPSSGKIPPNTSLISDNECESLYLREYTNILNGLYNNPELEEKARIFKSYVTNDTETFITTLKFLLEHRNCRIVIPNKKLENFDDKYKDEKIAINKIINNLIKHPEIITSSNSDNIDILIRNIRRYRQTLSLSWDDNLTNVYYALKNTLASKNFRLYLGDETENVLGSVIDYFVEHLSRGKATWYEPSEKITSIVKEIEANKYQATLSFVEEAKTLILKKLRVEGKLTFSDYLVYLRDTLKLDAQNEGKLIKHIGERHKYFMIDEFQDTDPIQSEIFFYLAAKEINADWKKCVPNSGSLFIVGDPKQSIYRFKNADVAAFLNVKKMFENKEIGEVLNLYCNFRSTYQIRTWFNKTFESLLVDSADQSSYPLIPTDECEMNDDFSGIYSYETPKKDETIKDSDKVAEIILKLVDNPKYQISVKEFIDDKEVIVKRNLKWKDFMLITPGKGKLGEYTSTFRRQGIPYFVEGNIIFKECPALVEINKIYNAISHPQDNRYLYLALKSRMFNISENELISLRENRIYLNVNSDIENVNISNNLNSALNKLKELSTLTNIYNPSTLFKKLIEDSEAFEIIGNKNMEYIYFVLELVKTKESSNEIVSHQDLSDYLNDLLENNANLERCPGLKKDGNAVHLANLHKVKGLEAPVVILASPTRRGKSPEFRLVKEEDENLGYVFKVARRNSIISSALIETEIYDDLKQLEEISQEAENLRLAYVGATRARNVLIISSNTLKTGQSKTNPWKYLLNDYVDDLSIALKDDKMKTVDKLYVDELSLNKDTLKLDESLSSNSFVNLSPSNLVNDNLSYVVDIEDERLDKQAGETNDLNAALIGTMVHRLLELIINSKDRLEKNKLIKLIINEFKKDLDNELVTSFKNILDEVYTTMHNGGYKQIYGLKDDILSILLNAEEVKTEIPFSYKEDNNLVSGIIDLVYKDKDGYHIIDWKTNKDGLNLSEHYRGQLNAYKKAFKKITDIDVKDALIYHISIK